MQVPILNTLRLSEFPQFNFGALSLRRADDGRGGLLLDSTRVTPICVRGREPRAVPIVEERKFSSSVDSAIPNSISMTANSPRPSVPDLFVSALRSARCSFLQSCPLRVSSSLPCMKSIAGGLPDNCDCLEDMDFFGEKQEESATLPLACLVADITLLPVSTVFASSCGTSVGF